MNKNELKKYIIKNNYPSGRSLKSSKHEEFVTNLINETSFLPENSPLPNRCYCIIHDIIEYPVCECCGKLTKVGPSKDKTEKYHKNGFRKYCSNSCSSKGEYKNKFNNYEKRTGFSHPMHNPEILEKIKENNIERYGEEYYFSTVEFKNANKKTCLEKYGFEHHLYSLEIRTKIEDTVKRKYGVYNVFQGEDVKEKIKETNLKIYGFEDHMQNKEVFEKSRKTYKDKTGYKFPLQNPIVKKEKKEKLFKEKKRYDVNQLHWSDDTFLALQDKNRMQDLYIKYRNSREIAKILNIGSHRTVLLALHHHEIKIQKIISRSSQEKEICKFLEENNINYEISNRKILEYSKEIDIFLPEYNLCIEFNGLFWHSSRFKNKDYHQKKTLELHEKGFKVLQIYEDIGILKKIFIKKKF